MKKTTDAILALCLVLSLYSCYQDLSTESTFEIPELQVTSEEYPDDIINIPYGQVLDISVNVSQEGRSDEDFSYFWEVDLDPGRISSDRIELGTESKISYQIASSPSTTPYVLSVRVTDLITGYAVYRKWNMYVVSALGEGLLVAHTRDGGQTSDLDLVAAEPITYGFSGIEPLYTRNAYSLANNGTTVEGRVNSICSRLCSNLASYNKSNIILGTEHHILALDPLTYKVESSDNELFGLSNETSYGTEAVFNYSGYMTAAILNGTLYVITANNDYLYNPVSYGMSPANVFSTRNTAYSKLIDNCILAVFDESREQFFYIYGWSSGSSSFITLDCGDPSFSLTGADCIAAGHFASTTIAFLMQDASGSYHLSTVQSYSTGRTYTDYDINSLPEIEEAIDFAFCDNGQLMYYVTPDSIYRLTVAGNTVNVGSVTWSPDSPDEKITSIEQYQQAWYGTHQYDIGSYEFSLPTNRTQVIITTYNETTGEGKIYLRGYNVATGRFSLTGDNGVFGGFGEITAVAPTFR